MVLDAHGGRIELADQNGEVEIGSHDGPIRVEGHVGPLASNLHDSTIRLRSVDGCMTIDAYDSGIEAEDLRDGLEIGTHEGSDRFAVDTLTGVVPVPAAGDFEIRMEWDPTTHT